jgi:hypothetical protein
VYAHLRAGNVTLYELLEAPPACVGNARICDVLHHARGLGDKGVDKVLQETMIWPLTKVNQLSRIDVAEILTHLPDRVPKKSALDSKPSNVKWDS